jgi:hypothetical protein
MMKNWFILLFSGAIQSNVLNLRTLLATSAAYGDFIIGFCTH